MLENEEWRECPLDPRYKVSNMGRVIGQKGFLLGFGCSSKGYLTVTRRIDGKPKSLSVHRMVASAFIPNPKNLPVVNHKDGNRVNNMASNLEWITIGDNIRHAARVLQSYGGEKHCRARITSHEAIEIFHKLKDPTLRYDKLCEEYGTTYPCIAHMAKGNSWHKEREIAGYIPFKRLQRRKSKAETKKERGHV